MKFYATVQSERGKAATRGGQQFLLVEIEHQKRLVARVKVDEAHGVALYPVGRIKGKHARARVDINTGEIVLD